MPMLWALNDEQNSSTFTRGNQLSACDWKAETETSANKKSPQENKKTKKTRPERKKH